MARKKKQDEGSSGAYWMDTYGDMITLVLTFFVLLFSMSSLDEAKWEALVATLTGTTLEVVAPLNPGKSVAPDPTDEEPEPMTPEQKALQDQENQSKETFDELYQRIMELVSENQLESMLIVERREDTIYLRFVDSLLFDSGSADLRLDSMEIITGVRMIMEDTQASIDMIHIEGHTDNVPISNGRFRDNWDLSAMRASTVLRVLIEGVLDPTKMSVAGRGEFIPIDTNETEEGRARNRRVDIQIERMVIDVGYDPYPNQRPGEAPSQGTQDLWDLVGG